MADSHARGERPEHDRPAGDGYALSMRATIMMTITATAATMKKKTICGTVYASIVSLQSTPGETSTPIVASLHGMSGPLGASVREP